MRVIRIFTDQGRFGTAEIGDKLEDLQHEVNGYIEPVYLPELYEHGIIMLVNEEGVLRGLPVNVNLIPFFYVGNAIFVNSDGEDFISLTDDQVKIAMKWLTGLPL